MDPAGIIAGWKQRLINLADHPGYVYVNTPRRLIKQEYRRLTTFVGYPESEVAAAESRLGVRFPAVGQVRHLAGITRGEPSVQTWEPGRRYGGTDPDQIKALILKEQRNG